MMVFQVVGSLTLILGGLLVVLKILKKYVPSMAIARELAVTEQLHLGDRCRLMIEKIRGEKLLREKDLKLFVDVSGGEKPKKPDDLSMRAKSVLSFFFRF
jgi:hypothetical protein